MIGTSPPMHTLREQIRSASNHTATVLISGESGTGKELVAKAIHEYSRRPGRFVAVDCGALPDDLVEEELFGYQRGAFTGATHDKEGLFEAAQRGTLFLDEISNTSLRLQGKLLRVLQEGTIRRLGSTHDKQLDVRVLAATNTDLAKAAATGAFRTDLRYRFAITLNVPPLRTRGHDIELLAHYFAARLGKPTAAVHLSDATIAHLRSYDFPGNVRELENIITTGFYNADGKTIEPEHLPITNQNASQQQWASFWELANAYLERRATRAQVETVLRDGLRATQGRYNGLTEYFGMPQTDYKRLMDFLRRHQLKVDFRQYRVTR
jgi:DNA-binding NtrC family response regulator